MIEVEKEVEKELEKEVEKGRGRGRVELVMIGLRKVTKIEKEKE